MVGSLIVRLVLIFGYVHPAYKCFKTVEMKEPDIEQLLFWCKYWIIVVGLTVCERIANMFIAWVPMFGEAKLAIFIYLSFNKTKGTTYLYESFVRPYISKREKMIDHFLLKLNTRAVYYYKKAPICSWARIDEILQYLGSQSIPLMRAQFLQYWSQYHGRRVPRPTYEQGSSLPFGAFSIDEFQEHATKQYGASEDSKAVSTAAAFNEQTRATPTHIESCKIIKSNDKKVAQIKSAPPAAMKPTSHESPKTLKEGRRMVWLVLALCSLAFPLILLENSKLKEVVVILKVDYWDRLPNGIILVVPSEFKKVVVMLKVDDWVHLLKGIILVVIILVVTAIYVSLLFYLAYDHKIKPLELPHFAKLFFEIVFLHIPLWLNYFVEDFWGIVFWFSICFHVIPVLNLLGSCENFDLLYCVLVLLVELAFVSPNYAPHIFAVISAAFLWMKISYEHSKEQLAEKENLADLSEKENLAKPL